MKFLLAFIIEETVFLSSSFTGLHSGMQYSAVLVGASSFSYCILIEHEFFLMVLPTAALAYLVLFFVQ